MLTGVRTQGRQSVGFCGPSTCSSWVGRARKSGMHHPFKVHRELVATWRDRRVRCCRFCAAQSVCWAIGLDGWQRIERVHAHFVYFGSLL